MKFTVKMSCGHEETVEIFGRTNYIENRIMYLEEHGLCKKCYWKAKEEAMERNRKALGELRALKGSVKQIAWAEDLRVQILTAVKHQVEEEKSALCNHEEELEFYTRVTDKFFAWLSEQAEAKFWIEHRDMIKELRIFEEALFVQSGPAIF